MYHTPRTVPFLGDLSLEQINHVKIQFSTSVAARTINECDTSRYPICLPVFTTVNFNCFSRGSCYPRCGKNRSPPPFQRGEKDTECGPRSSITSHKRGKRHW